MQIMNAPAGHADSKVKYWKYKSASSLKLDHCGASHVLRDAPSVALGVQRF